MSIKTDQGSGHGGGGHGQDDGSGQGQGIVGVVCQTSAWIILIKGQNLYFIALMICDLRSCCRTVWEPTPNLGVTCTKPFVFDLPHFGYGAAPELAIQLCVLKQYFCEMSCFQHGPKIIKTFFFRIHKSSFFMESNNNKESNKSTPSYGQKEVWTQWSDKADNRD